MQRKTMPTETMLAKENEPGERPVVGIIMGSKSDCKVMIEAARILEELGIPYSFNVVSAHRTPNEMYEYAETAEERGLKIIIAGAGGAAHLPGMVAAKTDLPVIGVPIHTTALSGLDSLFSMVQMPGGVPVATVAINGAKNAALIAARALGMTDIELRQKLKAYKQNMHDETISSDQEAQKELQELKHRRFIDNISS